MGQNEIDSLKEAYDTWLEEDENSIWSDIAYPLLRSVFADQEKFRKFLVSNGIHALRDEEGHDIFFGEPQVIVMDPSIIEWGPREENVPDNKVYIMSALRSKAKP